VAKICNNMLLGITMIGVAEAMNLGAALGSTPRCSPASSIPPVGAAGAPTPTILSWCHGERACRARLHRRFGADLMLKDLGWRPMRPGRQNSRLYWARRPSSCINVQCQGIRRQDFSAIINMYRQRNDRMHDRRFGGQIV